MEAGDGRGLYAQRGGSLLYNGALMGCVLREQLEGELLNHVRLGIYPKTGTKIRYLNEQGPAVAGQRRLQ
ncbi:hypothetical protein CCY01nite_07110 [Chitinophaga cymbidii]|uniref:Uncharacterized protein n=1 Tax=Chitinophaga cymbidii TaxID=1096750 RepID=A0A512RFH8_9BACT|nr:hypothetical protein CCY01nite_07110 [Chitinophaga cymbidii]